MCCLNGMLLYLCYRRFFFICLLTIIFVIMMIKELFFVIVGEIINEKDRCKECKGKKVINEIKILEVYVDKGMKDG